VSDDDSHLIELSCLDYDEWAWNTDQEIFAELWAAILQEQERSFEQVIGEKEWVEKGKAYHDGVEVSPWFNIDDKPGIDIDGNVINNSRVPWDIEQELIKFDEDFEYESWFTNSEPLPSGRGDNCSLIPHSKAIQGINMHRLLSYDVRNRTADSSPYGIAWAGSYEEVNVRCGIHARAACGPAPATLGELHLRDRFTTRLVIKTKHPEGKKAYAKGACDWGDIYIPETFRGKIPEIGENSMMTIALQDVGGNGKKVNAFRWTAIYNHN